VSWRITADVGEFFARAGDQLAADPVENTLLLTIADGDRRAAASPGPPGAAAPLYGWQTGNGNGAFVHTPGFPVVLGAMTGAAAAALAALLHDRGHRLTAVNGAPAAANAFAAQWRQATGPQAATLVFQRQRLFRLGELTAPAPPPGRARVAAAADRDRLAAWISDFLHEAGAAGDTHGAAMADGCLAYGGLLVWEADGRLVATAARTRVVGAMARIGPVYTPPQQRGKGYGGAITVATGQAAQQAGAREVVLFTDLANPTSNALYQRLGYHPVSDRAILSFTAV
jgi:predicted GNAT family acetyltransferase